MPNAASAFTVGFVGAGQLARMAAEAASTLGIRVIVLAERPDDAAVESAAGVVLGTPGDWKALSELARRSDVVTFDHELVDLELLARLEEEGVAVRPGTSTLRMAVDKSVMRQTLTAAGLPAPAYEVLGLQRAGDAEQAVTLFAAHHGWPVVVKAARGGYDGRGVWPVAGPEEAATVCAAAEASGTPLLLEEMVAIDAELAVVVARRPSGESVAWPTVETAQVDGMCREVLFPGRLDPSTAQRAAEIARAVADVADAVGVLAIELFATRAGLVVNEVAARPHNSAHWTIEGAVTSQFENHLRAVLDLPLGVTDAAAAQVAMVNVVGGPDAVEDGLALADGLAVPGAHLHLYGKGPRPGRKLGHVTVCGDEADDVRTRAWAAARALGTPMPASLRTPSTAPATDKDTDTGTAAHTAPGANPEETP